MPFGHDMLRHWPLDPDITYLNHGTVGAVPRPVLAAQQALRDEMERRPSQFMLREVSEWVRGSSGRPTRMRQAATEVARFLGARGEDLVFVDNATAGVNAVLRSFPLYAGDEILLTDHAYGAVARAAAYTARQHGARVVTVGLPYPAFDPDGARAAIASAITPRTRLAIVDHVAAESAVIMPVAAIVAACRAKGVATLIDGAHVPGALALDIPSVGADWYIANLHKWAHAPRSCGVLWAEPSRQAGLHPPVISWGLDEGFTAEFDWVGTRDPTPWLAAPAGITFLETLGFDQVRRYNHDLAWHAAQALTDRWGTTRRVDEASLGTMATVPLPLEFGQTQEDAIRLRDALLFEDRIEVQLHAGHGQLWVRVSAQVYNDRADIARLADAVAARRQSA